MALPFPLFALITARDKVIDRIEASRVSRKRKIPLVLRNVERYQLEREIDRSVHQQKMAVLDAVQRRMNKAMANLY